MKSIKPFSKQIVFNLILCKFASVKIQGMNKIKYGLLFVMILSVSLLPAQEVMRVMCYNVENFFDCDDDPKKNDEEFLPDSPKAWTYSRYKEKQSNISKVIVSLGGWNAPAIVGLVEVESRKALTDLTLYSELKNLKYKFIHHESPDARGIDVALLYQPNLFKPFNNKPLRINFPEAPRSKTRDVLLVSGRVPTGDTLHVFVCHFPSRIGGADETADKRNYVAGVIRAQVDSLYRISKQPNIIIMGDMNDYPDNASMKDVLKAQKPGAPYSDKNLYNLMFPLQQKGIGSHKYRGEWGMLDQIVVSGNLMQEDSKIHTLKNEAAVFDADFLMTEDEKYMGKMPLRTYAGPKYLGGFADHLPVYFDLNYTKLKKSSGQ